MIGLTGPLAAPVNQLAEPTSDAQPDENARDNCAGACLSWAIRQLAGVTTNGDTLKDRAYGQGYVGLTALDTYRAAVAPYGLHIADLPASLDAIKGALGRQHPVIVGIASDWGDNPPTSPYVHFVVMAQGTGGYLTAMNPWGGFWQDQPETWWAARLRLGTVWELSTSEVSTVWTIERDAGGNVTGAHDAKSVHIGAGFAWELTQRPAWLASDAIIGESYYADGQCVCALDNGAWMDWSHTAPGTVNAHTDGGAIVATLYNLTAAAAERIQQLQAELKAAQAGSGSGSGPADAAITALAAALAAMPKAS